MRRSNDRDPQKQLNQKNINKLGQKLDNGLLVMHVNQTQDLLVKTISASTEQPCSQIIAGNADCVKLWVFLSSCRISELVKNSSLISCL